MTDRLAAGARGAAKEVSHARTRVISGATISTSAVMFGLLAVFSYFNSLSYDGQLNATTDTIVYVFGIALVPLAAVAAFIGVTRFPPGDRVRTQWLLISGAVATFALGDIAWMILELGMGIDPYPSIADVFYVSVYAFFLAAAVAAIGSYRHLVAIKMPVIVASIVALAATAVVYVALLQPYILPAGTDELSAVGKMVSTIYPLGDVLFMLGPAVALALVIGRLGRGRLAWPWWIVVVGAVVFAVTDSWYAYADWSGIGTTAVLDAGWIGANMLLATAVFVARDVSRY